MKFNDLFYLKLQTKQLIIEINYHICVKHKLSVVSSHIERDFNNRIRHIEHLQVIKKGKILQFSCFMKTLNGLTNKHRFFKVVSPIRVVVKTLSVILNVLLKM